MSNVPLDEIEIRNRETLEELARTLEWSVGEFHLYLVRCNYASVRSHLIALLQSICTIQIRVISLTSDAQQLYATIRAALGDEQPDAVMIVGFEQVQDLDRLFAAADTAREEFRKNFQFPLVFWLDDKQFNCFKDRAPNFETWAPVDTPSFAIASNHIIQSLKQGIDAVYTAAFDPQQMKLFTAVMGVAQFGDLHRLELPQAIQTLRDRAILVPPDLIADLHLVQGIDAGDKDEAIAHFQTCIEQWRHDGFDSSVDHSQGIHLPSHLKLALVLFFLGRFLFNKVDATRRSDQAQYVDADWQQVRSPLEESIRLFEAADRPDMVAKTIRRLEGTLRRLQDWNQLEPLAHRAIALHQTYHMPYLLAMDYGFLAEVAISREQWIEAKQFAEQALATIQPLPLQQQWAEGLYLSLLARAEAQLGNTETAISLLERARNLGDCGHPTTYCIILADLRQLYWQQRRYLEAFKLKQARLEVEKVAGIRAFVGAGRLGAQAKLLAESQHLDDLAPEIRASGRQRDLEKILGRIGSNDSKLTVMHGSSGVGKSSLVNAGLIPTLQHKSIGTKNNLPVLVRKYTGWVTELGDRLTEAWSDRLGRNSSGRSERPFTPREGDKFTDILDRLQQCDRLNLRPVLIFDQFEEFFFANTNPLDRRRFFEFLSDCLQIPFINIILSLREDYIHYLLEANRLKGMSAIGNDMLGKNVLYYLGNFAPGDAKAIIQDLTSRSRSHLEADLVDALVEDLAGALGEVRPIELQIVGSQLETEGIKGLVDYRALGAEPKEELVKRYLDEVVQDCGEGYEQIAELVLYLLTDERGTRPLKTRSELEQELETLLSPLNKEGLQPEDFLGDEADPIFRPDRTPPQIAPDYRDTEEVYKPLDYVLRILCGSGIVVYLPEAPDDRYQLVHDYIAEAIRQQKAPQIEKLMGELAEERQKREQAELLQRQTAEQLESARLANQKAQRRLVVGTGVLVVSLVASLVAVPVAIVAGNQANSAIHREQTATKNFDEAQNQLEQVQTEKVKADAAVANAQQKVAQAQVELTELTAKNDASEVEIEAAEERLTETQRQFEQAKRLQEEAQVASNAARRLQNQSEIERELAQEETRFTRIGTRLERAGIDAIRRFEPQQTEALLSALRAAYELNTLNQDNYVRSLEEYSAKSPLLALQTILDSIRETRIESDSYNARFSPDGNYITTSTHASGDAIQLWDLQGNKLEIIENPQEISQLTTHQVEIRSTNLHRENERVLVLDRYGNELANFEDPLNEISQVTVSPDNNLLAVARYTSGLTLQDKNGQEVARIPYYGASHVGWIIFSPDSNRIATYADDGPIQIWDLTGNELLRIRTHLSLGINAFFSPDGESILTTGDSSAQIWSLNGNEMTKVEGYPYEIWSVSSSPSGSHITTIGDYAAWLWDQNGNNLVKFEDHHPDISDVDFSSSNNHVATSSYTDETIRLWSLEGEELLKIESHAEGVRDIEFSADGYFLAAGLQDGRVKIWDINGNLLLEHQAFEGANVTIRQIAFSPNGKYISVTGNYNFLVLLNVEENTSRKFENAGLYANFSSDSMYIVTSGETLRESTMGLGAQLWSLSGEKLEIFEGSHSPYLEPVFSPDGNYVATIEEESNTVILWRIDGSVLAVLEGHWGDVYEIVFSPNGDRVATSSGEDGTTRIWDLQGQQIAQYEGYLGAFNEDWSRVWVVQPANRLVSDAEGEIVTMWRVDDLQGLIARACDRLRPFLIQSDSVTDDDRAMCNISPRNESVSEGDRATHPIYWFTHTMQRWLGVG